MGKTSDPLAEVLHRTSYGYISEDSRFRVRRIGDYTRGPNWQVTDVGVPQWPRNENAFVQDLVEARGWIWLRRQGR